MCGILTKSRRESSIPYGYFILCFLWRPMDFISFSSTFEGISLLFEILMLSFLVINSFIAESLFAPLLEVMGFDCSTLADLGGLFWF